MTYEQRQATLYDCENQLAAARDANCPAPALVRICQRVRDALHEVQVQAEQELLAAAREGRL